MTTTSSAPSLSSSDGHSILTRWYAEPAVAAVWEPRLLRHPDFARRALGVVERVTADLAELPPEDRRTPPVRTLRQALGYGWSVVIAAIPDAGLTAFHGLELHSDADVQWIVRENGKKRRLQRLVDSAR